MADLIWDAPVAKTPVITVTNTSAKDFPVQAEVAMVDARVLEPSGKYVLGQARPASIPVGVGQYIVATGGLSTPATNVPAGGSAVITCAPFNTPANELPSGVYYALWGYLYVNNILVWKGLYAADKVSIVISPKLAISTIIWQG